MFILQVGSASLKSEDVHKQNRDFGDNPPPSPLPYSVTETPKEGDAGDELRKTVEKNFPLQ